MNGNANTPRAGRQMRRLVALLLDLAGLAERAAGRSAPVRHFVLWLLAMGEAVAGDYVLDLTGRPASGQAAFAPARRDAAAAMGLAARFRALAAALAAFVDAVAATWQADLRHAWGALPAAFGALASPAGPSSMVERRDSS